MSSLATPPIPPHFHEHSRLSPTRSMSSSNPSTRKRKASPSSEDDDQHMSTSPALSSARLPNPILQPQSRKRVRSNVEGRPLSLDRLLETLDKDSLRSLLQTLSDRHPSLKDEIVQLSPRPSIQSTLQVLRQYYDKLMTSFPLDPNPRSDYSYDRVKPQWVELLNALADFTPQFMPPNESQSSVSLDYLDGATQIVHDLPEWDSAQHNIAKRNAYEEIARAWAIVIREAGKRGGGIQLQYGGWEEKLRHHNEKSHGFMREAYEALMTSLGWLRPGMQAGPGNSQQQQQQSIRQQLLSGTYGVEQPSMRTGMW